MVKHSILSVLTNLINEQSHGVRIFFSYMVHLVLHPHGIPPAFLKQERKKSDKERKIVRKKLSFMYTKRLNTFLKCKLKIEKF